MRKRMILQDKKNWVLKEHHCTTPVGPSETVPDDTLTIKQIMQKHVRGMELEADAMRTPIYQEESDFDSPDLEAVHRMDLADKHEMAEALAADILERKAALEAAKKAIDEKSKADKIAKKALKSADKNQATQSHQSADDSEADKRPLPLATGALREEADEGS